MQSVHTFPGGICDARRACAQRQLRSRPALRVRATAAQKQRVPVSENGTSTPDACKNFKIAAYSSKGYVRNFLEKPLKATFPNSNFIEVCFAAPASIAACSIPTGVYHRLHSTQTRHYWLLATMLSSYL
jgi:hypothetical protein